MRKDKIIYDIVEAVRAYNKDAKLSNAYILHLVNTTRAKYIRQLQRKNPGEDTVNYTQTMFLKTEIVDRSYLPASAPVDLSIIRTVKVLPNMVGKEILKNIEIRPIDRIGQEIEYMDKTRAIYGNSQQFIFAFLDDDHHMYLVNRNNNLHKLIENMGVTAILEEPDAITDINENEDHLTEYPMPASTWALLKPEVLELVLNTMQIKVDTVSDNQTIQ